MSDESIKITLGCHSLTVNPLPIELTLIPYNSADATKAAVHLTHTNFTEVLEEIHWDTVRENELPPPAAIESAHIYRSEYLAAAVWQTLPVTPVVSPQSSPQSRLNSVYHFMITRVPLPLRRAWRSLSRKLPVAVKSRLSQTVTVPANQIDSTQLLEQVHRYIAAHPEEHYDYGIHDIDAVTILEKWLSLETPAGGLRFSPLYRAVAQLFWAFGTHSSARHTWENSISSLYQLSPLLGATGANCIQQLGIGLRQALTDFVEQHSILFSQIQTQTIDKSWVARRASEYLLEELQQTPLTFTTSALAEQLVDGFWRDLEEREQRLPFEDNLRSLANDWSSQWLSIHTALTNHARPLDGETNYYLPEAVAIILTRRHLFHQLNTTNLQALLTVLGQHPRIKNRTLSFQFDEFTDRLHYGLAVQLPAYQAIQLRRSQLLETAQKRWGMEQYRPTVSPTWVCHRLLKTVHFNVIGDNLTRQLEQGHHGALCLIAPSGFGKTSLVEYLAYQLGMLLVRVDCAIIGSSVTSFAPTMAPHAAACQELEKLQVALAIGHHVVLLLDNVHHGHPEFLQQLLPLLEPSRTISGLWQGQLRTYELRGKRFALILAGTEMTWLPSIVANRIDICQLATVSEANEALLALSYVEIALPTQPILATLVGRDQDLDQWLQLARGEEVVSPQELTTTETADELSNQLNLLKKLLQLQAVMFKIHQHYVTTLTQTDQSRTAPPCQLLGNYRTMNKLAAQLTVSMNEVEVKQLILDHYFEQVHLLPTGREEQWLQLLAMVEQFSPSQAARWQVLQGPFTRLSSWHDDSTLDPMSRLVKQLQGLGEQLQKIQTTLAQTESSSLAALPKLVDALIDSQLAVNIVNQLPVGMEESLRILINMVDQTLLPIVQDYERKSKLDLVIFERIKEMSDVLKDLQKELTTGGKLQKTYKPLSFKD